MESKNIIVVVVLIAVIIAAAIVIQRRMSSSAGGPPAWVLQQPMSKINMKTLEVSTAAQGDWAGKYAPDASGHFKSPKTGEYTMTDIIICSACGKQIPSAPIPPEVMKMDRMQRNEATQKACQDYVCPYCKKNPYGAPPR